MVIELGVDKAYSHNETHLVLLSVGRFLLLALPSWPTNIDQKLESFAQVQFQVISEILREGSDYYHWRH